MRDMVLDIQFMILTLRLLLHLHLLGPCQVVPRPGLRLGLWVLLVRWGQWGLRWEPHQAFL